MMSQRCPLKFTHWKWGMRTCFEVVYWNCDDKFNQVIMFQCSSFSKLNGGNWFWRNEIENENQTVRSVRFTVARDSRSHVCLLPNVIYLLFSLLDNFSTLLFNYSYTFKGFDRIWKHFAHKHFYLESINYQSEARKICNNLSNVLLWRNDLVTTLTIWFDWIRAHSNK